MKKRIIIFISLFVSAWMCYYLLAIKPVDDAWNYCVSVMSGKTVPEQDEEISVFYPSAPKRIQNVATVDLKIHRYFIRRWGNQIKMSVKYWQDFFDEDGVLLWHTSCASQWTFTKVNGTWVLTDIAGVIA